VDRRRRTARLRSPSSLRSTRAGRAAVRASV
jgi:hypothetical protein